MNKFEKQINEIINEVITMKTELETCQTQLKQILLNGEINSLNSLLVFFDCCIKDIKTLSTLKEPLSKDKMDSILLLLNFVDYLNNPNISNFLKRTLISINNSSLEENNYIKGIINNEKKYYHNQNIIYNLNNHIIQLIEKKFAYKNKIIDFNKKIIKSVVQKLNVALPFDYENIFKEIDNLKILDSFQDLYKGYINNRTNQIIEELNNKFNIHNNIEIKYFNTEDAALKEITKLVNEINTKLVNEKLEKSQQAIIEMIEGKNKKYKDRQDFNLISILEVDYKNDIYKCKSNAELSNQVKIYSDLITKTTNILLWSYYLEIDITNAINNIKTLINKNGIKYIVNSYEQIINRYIVNHIVTILNNKFQLKSTNNIVASLVKDYIKNYDNPTDETFSRDIKIITKESIKAIIKEKIKAIPKKLFKSQFSILTTVDEEFNIFYDQLNNNEISLDELIQLISTQDENFNTLINNINEEIELIFLCLNTEKLETITNDFDLFIKNCLSQYKDSESRKWILNYLKLKTYDNNILTAVIDNCFDKTNINNDHQNKNESTTCPTISQPTTSELSNISYILLKDSLKNNINKNTFHSNEEREKYLYIIREFINYLISNSYKENNNSKFVLKKYQKSNICWKLKRTNNEMLIRMGVNFQKDIIIIGSIFKRPDTNKRYNHYIDEAENNINNIIDNLENENIYGKLQFVYENIINLKEFYDFLHHNISDLTLDEINEDNKIISKIIFKFINDINSINYTILPFKTLKNIDILKDNLLTILENYGYQKNGKILIKK